MAYIDKAFYDNVFHGKSIPNDDFDRIADAASDVVYELCYIKPDEAMQQELDFKRAVAYQTEFISEQGGLDAILGFSAAAVSGGGERLGDYSVNAGGTLQESAIACNGIPVSGMALMLLKKLGLRVRWAYAERYRNEQKKNST
jgi:hypothetical protein